MVTAPPRPRALCPQFVNCVAGRRDHGTLCVDGAAGIASWRSRNGMQFRANVLTLTEDWHVTTPDLADPGIHHLPSGVVLPIWTQPNPLHVSSVMAQ